MLSTSYLEKVEKLPRLEDQGDGMRSFATVTAAFVGTNKSILLIDEPEAFLHPPQARVLGRFIGAKRKKNSQTIVATHSADVIKGVMETRSAKVHIGRITRSADGRKSQIFWIRPDDTAQFTTDPLLRTTNALEALLHDETILTEADRDAVFYQVVLDSLGSGAPRADRLFLHTGGKHRFPSLASALVKLGVRPKIIADVDLLRTQDVLGSVLEAVGAASAPILHLADRIGKSISQRAPPVTGQAVLNQVQAILSEIDHPQNAVADNVLRGLRRVADAGSPWASVKLSGARAVLKGDMYRAYEDLEGQLANEGIWLVPVGELEGFCRSAGAKGQRWLDSVLSKDVAADPELEPARRFVSQIFTRAQGVH